MKCLKTSFKMETFMFNLQKHKNSVTVYTIHVHFIIQLLKRINCVTGTCDVVL